MWFVEAWRRFAPAIEGWAGVEEQQGPEALEQVGREVLSGRAEPRAGHVLTF